MLRNRIGGPDAQRSGAADRQMQILLSESYRRTLAQGGRLPRFADIEFSSYSQNGEDGILLFIFSLVGMTSRRVVEICAGDGIECNAANLIINHGWTGLLVDGDAKAVARGQAFYAGRTNAWRFHRLPPTLIQAWVTTEGINQLVADHGFTGEIDLLSLDLDGVDFWIWKSLSVVSPRVVVLEYNNRWAAHQSVTVPYASTFTGTGASEAGEGYFGASLLAFARLGKEKGYRLVGANGPNTNAFFLRHDVAAEIFPEVTVESCLASEYARHQHRTKYPLIKDRPVVEIA